MRSLIDFGVILSDLAPVWILSSYFVEVTRRGFENFAVYLVQGDLDRLLCAGMGAFLLALRRYESTGS